MSGVASCYTHFITHTHSPAKKRSIKYLKRVSTVLMSSKIYVPIWMALPMNNDRTSHITSNQRLLYHTVTECFQHFFFFSIFSCTNHNMQGDIISMDRLTTLTQTINAVTLKRERKQRTSQLQTTHRFWSNDFIEHKIQLNWLPSFFPKQNHFWCRKKLAIFSKTQNAFECAQQQRKSTLICQLYFKKAKRKKKLCKVKRPSRLRFRLWQFIDESCFSY